MKKEKINYITKEDLIKINKLSEKEKLIFCSLVEWGCRSDEIKDLKINNIFQNK